MVDQPHHICAPCRVFGGSVEYSDFTSVHPDGIVLSAGSQPPQDDRHHTCRLSPACGGAVRLFQLHYCFLLMIIIDSLTAQWLRILNLIVLLPVIAGSRSTILNRANYAGLLRVWY